METIPTHLRAGLDYLFLPFAWLLLACRVTPNQVSLMGILLNLITAWLIVDGQLLLAGPMYLLAGGLDLLDGVLARLAKMATRFGAFLDSTADRISRASCSPRSPITSPRTASRSRRPSPYWRCSARSW